MSAYQRRCVSETSGRRGIKCGVRNFAVRFKNRIISRVPANDLGRYIQNRVRFCGVSDDYLVYDSTKDSRLGIYYYEYGAHPRKPNVVYDRKNTAFTEISIDDFPEKMFTSARCFHTTGITLALGQKTRNTAVEMIKRFKEMVL